MLLPKLFYKYHSLGNDFVLFDCRDLSDDQKNALIKGAATHAAAALCDRHFGLGADGVLCLVSSDQALARVVVYNSDGSLGGMCLNGLRCVSVFLAHQISLTSLNLEMAGRIIECHISQNQPYAATVTTAVPRIVLGKYETIEAGGVVVRGRHADLGNPHFVIQQSVERSWLEKYGSALESHHIFPHKANIEFLWPAENGASYNLLVYERGCGVTLACSSGAAAATAALAAEGLIEHKAPIALVMLGGTIEAIALNATTVKLTAQAMCVARGEQYRV